MTAARLTLRRERTGKIDPTFTTTLGLMIEPMKSLELKIPPPAIAVLVAAAMWALSRRHSFTPSTNGHSPIVGASRCIGGHWILRGGCHLVPACKDDTQSNEATIDILIGELWHLHSYPEPHVCWLAARSHCIGDLSIFALGVARASGILSLHRALSNRTRGACAHRSIRRRVHRLPV